MMKAYGHERRDKLECRYGCCTTKSGKDSPYRKSVDKAHRKTARRLAQEEIGRVIESIYRSRAFWPVDAI